jgi:predicted RecA/RadA family phage recombinase
MPVRYLATGKTAGEECSSTGEGRHLSLEESYLTHPVHGDGFVDKGDPVNCGDFVGVAFTSAAAATDTIAIDTEGIWFLNVIASDDVGTVAVAPGDQLYINTGVVSKKASGIPFGKSLGVLSGSVSNQVCAVKVHCELRDVDPSVIWVSSEGNDTTGKGCVDSPYATITKAFTMVTATRKTIFVLPGDYAEATTLVWPSISGTRLIGMDGQGNVAISSLAGTEVLHIDPTVQTSSFECFLENLYIDHAALIGIVVDNTATTKKVIVHLKNVASGADGTDSIHVAHTDAGNAIRIYARNCNEVEGRVYWHAMNGDDRSRWYDSVLIGGHVTSADANTIETSFIGCVILTATLTAGNGANVVTTIGCVYRTDAGVYTQLADAYSA